MDLIGSRHQRVFEQSPWRSVQGMAHRPSILSLKSMRKSESGDGGDWGPGDKPGPTFGGGGPGGGNILDHTPSFVALPGMVRIHCSALGLLWLSGGGIQFSTCGGGILYSGKYMSLPIGLHVL